MTRGEMRTMLRRRIDDTTTTGQRFANSDCDDELNKAAAFVGREISKHSGRQNYPNASEDVTTDGSAKVFALTNTNAIRVWKATRTDGADPEPCAEYDERLDAHYATSSGFDAQGRLLYYVKRNTSGTLSIGFPIVHDSGIVLTLGLTIRIAEIATGANDTTTYTLVPIEYHELIVQRAVVTLLAADDAGYAQQYALYRELYAEMVSGVGRKTEPAMIQDELGWN